MNRIRVAPVVVAALVHFIFGAVWYTALSEAWLRGIGKTTEELMAATGGKEPIAPYLVSFLCSLVIGYTLAWLLPRVGTVSAATGAKLGLILGIGIVVTTTWTEYAFEMRSFGITAINAGYPAIGMILMGAIIGGWNARADRPKQRMAAA